MSASTRSRSDGQREPRSVALEPATRVGAPAAPCSSASCNCRVELPGRPALTRIRLSSGAAGETRRTDPITRAHAEVSRATQRGPRAAAKPVRVNFCGLPPDTDLEVGHFASQGIPRAYYQATSNGLRTTTPVIVAPDCPADCNPIWCDISSQAEFEFARAVEAVTVTFGVDVPWSGHYVARIDGYWQGQHVAEQRIDLFQDTCGSLSVYSPCMDRVHVVLYQHPTGGGGLYSLTYTPTRETCAAKAKVMVALTFDYGPDPTEGPGQVNYTQQVLDALEALQIPATFFVDHINIRTLRGFVLLNKMVNAGHEVGIAGVMSNALHCSHAVVKQVTDRLSPALCAGRSARQCFEIHLDSMLSQLKLAGAVPRFARFPIGEFYTCRALETTSLPFTPCPAGKDLTRADEGLTFSDLRTAFAARNIRLYLHGGAGVHAKGKNRQFGPDSWWLQTEEEEEVARAVRELTHLMARAKPNSNSACAIVLAHDYDVTNGVRSPSILARQVGRLQTFVGELRDSARKSGVELEFVTLSLLAARCGGADPMDYREPSVCGL